MGRPAERWPTKALETLEATVDALKLIEATAKAAQDTLVAGNALAASSSLGDVRVMALEAMSDLLRARIGKYQQQEKTSRWQGQERRAASTTQETAARRP